MPRNKRNTILGGYCPRCRTGKMFPSAMYSRAALKMDETCSNCQFKYEIQPGFFWGAMFFNYAFVVAIFTIETTIMYWMGIMDTIWLYIVSPVSCIILLPVIFRFGRILFLHLFGGIKFEEKQV